MAVNQEVTILLLLEAVDKASGIIGKIGDAFGNLEDTLQKAADVSARTAAQQDALDTQLQASAAAKLRALELETAAQDKLATATRAAQEAAAQEAEWNALLKDSEAELAAATSALSDEEEFSLQVIRESAAAAAEAVKASVDAQIIALDELQAAQKEVAVRSQEMAAAEDAASTETGLGAAALGGLKVAAAGTAIGVGALGVLSSKAAASFQQMTTTLATSGGEMDKTGALLAQARDGILNLAQSTGTATDQLTKGLYMIGSAGFDAAHGGLDVLKAAAQGAKAENADLGVVSNALTTILLDTGRGADQATVSMDQMIAVVQRGKTTTQDLAASLANVLPVAESAGLKFEQVGGAIATMTAQGMSAQQSTQDLSNTIRNLQKPNNLAIQEMQALGIDSNKLSENLGKNGLTGTLQILTQAVAAHTHNGEVMLNTWYTSASAAADLKTMVASMTPQMQALANQFENGQISAKDFRTALYDLPPVQRNALMQFQTLADKAQGFNAMLKAGNPDAQTFNNALSTLTGGATGLTTSLLLSAQNGKLFAANVKAVGDAAQGAGSDVNGWSLIQGNFNQQLSQLKETVQVAAIRIGTALLPAMTKLLDAVTKIIQPIATWISQHQTLSAVILGVVGVLSTLLVVLISAVHIFKDVELAIKGIDVALTFLDDNPIILVITAIALAAYLIVTHWSTIKKWIGEFWDWLKKTAQEAWSFIKDHVNMVAGAVSVLLGPIGLIIAIALEIIVHWKTVKAWFDDFWGWMKRAAGDVAGFFEGVWKDISKPLLKEWKHISDDLDSIWQSLTTIWNATGGKLVALIARHWDQISEGAKIAWTYTTGLIRATLQTLLGVVKAIMDNLRAVFQVTWDLLKGVVVAAWDVIVGVVKGGLDVFIAIWEGAWDLAKGMLKAAWQVIIALINTPLDYLKDLLKLFADLVTGKWGKLWDDVKKIFSDAWNNIAGMFDKIGKDLLDSVLAAGKKIWDGFTSSISAANSGISKALTDVKNAVTSAFDDAIHWLEQAGKDIINGLINGVKSVWGDVKSTFNSLTSWIPSWKGPASTDKVLLTANGQLIMKSLITGIDSQTNALKAKLGQVTTTITASVHPTLSGAPLLATATAPTTTGTQGGIVIQNDLRGVQVISDRDIDALVQKIGARVATQLLPGGGVRIRS